MRKYLAQTLYLFGICSARYRAYAAVTVYSGQLLAPFLAHIAHKLVNGGTRNGSVLKLAARRVGRFYKHENSLVVLLAYLEQRLNAVRTEIAVDGESVAEKRLILLAAHLYLAEVSGRVGLHCCADIVALAIGDDVHSLGARVLLRFVERFNTRHAVHLVIRRLRLYRGNDIIKCVDKSLVELVKRLSRALERFAVLFKAFLLYVLRNIIQLGVKSRYRGVLCLFDLFDKSV